MDAIQDPSRVTGPAPGPAPLHPAGQGQGNNGAATSSHPLKPNELRDIGVNFYPHFLRRDMDKIGRAHV